MRFTDVDQHTPTIRVTDEFWDTVIAVDLTGTFSFCRESLLRLQEGQAESIVNVSSIAGAYGNGGAAVHDEPRRADAKGGAPGGRTRRARV